MKIPQKRLFFLSLLILLVKYVLLAATTLALEKCDVGYLEIEGSSPTVNRDWIPQVGVTFMKLNGAKSSSHGFVPGAKTKFYLRGILFFDYH